MGRNGVDAGRGTFGIIPRAFVARAIAESIKKLSTHHLHGGARTKQKNSVAAALLAQSMLADASESLCSRIATEGIRGTDLAAALFPALSAAAPRAAGRGSESAVYSRDDLRSGHGRARDAT
jgi:hypothetical protein